MDCQGIKSALHIVILQKTSHIYIIMNDSCVGNPKEGLAFKFSMKRPFNLFFFWRRKYTAVWKQRKHVKWESYIAIHNYRQMRELYMIKYIFAKRDTLAIQYHIKNWRLGVFGEEGLSPYHQITQPLGS